MSWIIACFCGHMYETEENKSHCPMCKASYVQDDRKLDLEQEMKDELARVIDLGEKGLL